MRNTKQTRVALLILALTGILCGLIILEIALRLLPSPTAASEDNNLFTCSSTVGWLGQSDYQGIATGEGFSHTIEFNSIGMHDTNHTFNKEDNTFRILLVGDSFVQAVQVKEAQTTHQQLENLLNEQLGQSKLSFEVISMGVGGWGTNSELLYYREQGRLFEADLVLLLFYIGNDLADNLPGDVNTIDGFNCFAPYFSICDEEMDPEPWYYIPGFDPAWNSCSPTRKLLTSNLSFIQQHSYLFARIEPLLLSFKPPPAKIYVPMTALYLPEESQELRYAWQVTENLLSLFNKEVMADGADFAVVIFGAQEVIWLSQFNEGQLAQFLKDEPHFVGAEFDRPNRHLVNFLQGQNIPVLDLQPLMIDYVNQTGVELYFPSNRHWTVEGNRVAAESIFWWLLDNDLLDNQN